jgi:regulator of sigma E protease
MLITILATVVVLGVLILVHELGHFWAAKAVDIEVSRFSIGFGPALFSFQWGETEYVLAAIPLGGYVKMEGMTGEEAVAPLEGPSARPSRQASPRDFDAKPWSARFLVIIAGVLMNFVFAFAAFTFTSHAQGVIVPRVGEVVEGSPAEAAGFLNGDLIVRLNGRRVADWQEVVRYISIRPEVPIEFGIEREGQALALTATPATVVEYNEIARDSVEFGRVGIGPATENALRKLTWGESVVEGWYQTGSWTGTIFDFLGRVVSGRSSAKELGGPIAIGQLSGDAARAGFWPFLTFMAIISVNLAVLNLLPIPVLDGGHILFLLLEAARGGRQVSVESRLRLTQIGLILVIGLMVLAFANDILRLVGV